MCFHFPESNICFLACLHFLRRIGIIFSCSILTYLHWNFSKVFYFFGYLAEYNWVFKLTHHFDGSGSLKYYWIMKTSRISCFARKCLDAKTFEATLLAWTSGKLSSFLFFFQDDVGNPQPLPEYVQYVNPVREVLTIIKLVTFWYKNHALLI